MWPQSRWTYEFPSIKSGAGVVCTFGGSHSSKKCLGPPCQAPRLTRSDTAIAGASALTFTDRPSTPAEKWKHIVTYRGRCVSWNDRTTFALRRRERYKTSGIYPPLEKFRRIVLRMLQVHFKFTYLANAGRELFLFALIIEQPLEIYRWMKLPGNPANGKTTNNCIADSFDSITLSSALDKCLSSPDLINTGHKNSTIRSFKI